MDYVLITCAFVLLTCMAVLITVGIVLIAKERLTKLIKEQRKEGEK